MSATTVLNGGSPALPKRSLPPAGVPDDILDTDGVDASTVFHVSVEYFHDAPHKTTVTKLSGALSASDLTVHVGSDADGLLSAVPYGPTHETPLHFWDDHLGDELDTPVPCSPVHHTPLHTGGELPTAAPPRKGRRPSLSTSMFSWGPDEVARAAEPASDDGPASLAPKDGEPQTAGITAQVFSPRRRATTPRQADTPRKQLERLEESVSLSEHQATELNGKKGFRYEFKVTANDEGVSKAAPLLCKIHMPHSGAHRVHGFHTSRSVKRRTLLTLAITLLSVAAGFSSPFLGGGSRTYLGRAAPHRQASVEAYPIGAPAAYSAVTPDLPYQSVAQPAASAIDPKVVAAYTLLQAASVAGTFGETALAGEDSRKDRSAADRARIMRLVAQRKLRKHPATEPVATVVAGSLDDDSKKDLMSGSLSEFGGVVTAGLLSAANFDSDAIDNVRCMVAGVLGTIVPGEDNEQLVLDRKDAASVTSMATFMFKNAIMPTIVHHLTQGAAHDVLVSGQEVLHHFAGKF